MKLLNDGNTTVSQAVVTIQRSPPVQRAARRYLGQACELVGTYVVTAADQALGKVINRAEGTTKYLVLGRSLKRML